MNTVGKDGKQYVDLTQFLNSLKGLLTAESQVLSDSLNDPSALSPAIGARYIVGPVPAGAWAGKTRQVATWTGFAWTFLDPTGMIFHVIDSDHLTFYSGLYYVNALTNQGSYQDLGVWIGYVNRAQAEAIAVEAAIVFGG